MEVLKKIFHVVGKTFKWLLIVAGVLAIAFVGLVVYEIINPSPKPPPEATTQKPPAEAPPPKPQSSKSVIKKSEAPKQVSLPSLPLSSEPVIVSVQFPKPVPLNQKNTVTVNFKDREGDVTKLILQDLNLGTTNEIDYSSKAAGKTSGALTFSQILKEAQISIRRLILVDKAGNQSAPYILTYKAGDTDAYYDRYDAEVLLNRSIERRKKIHFFILSNSEYKTELGNGSSFASETDGIGAVSPAVKKMFEVSVVPQINGLWDQCGVAFDLGMVKVVRPEKVNLEYGSGGTLVSLFGTIFETGEPFVIIGKSEDARGIRLIESVLPAFSIPTGDIAVFIVGPKFLDVNDESGAAGHAIKNLALVTWRYIHFQNETRGEIIIPKNIMKTLAHEIGHSLGLDHPGEGKAVPEDKFSEFNLMRQRKLRSELNQEQCNIVAGQF